MPVILEKLCEELAQSMTRASSPTFFSSKLTGNGKKQGFLSSFSNPTTLKPALELSSYADAASADRPKSSLKNNGTEEYHIPLFILPFSAYTSIKITTPHEDTSFAVKVGEVFDDLSQKNKIFDLYFQAVPHAIDIMLLPAATPAAPGTKQQKDRFVQVIYDARLIYVSAADPDGSFKHEYRTNTNTVLAPAMHPAPTNHMAHVCVNNLVSFGKKLLKLSNQVNINYSINFDHDAYTDYLANYSLFDEVQALATIWENTLPDYLRPLFESTKNTPMEMKTLVHSPDATEVCNVLNRLESYKIPLQLYRDIYHDIERTYAPDIATALCKTNLNLLLSNTLNTLEKEKPKLSHLPHQKTPPAIDPIFSTEQAAAITTNEPLALVQSVAGSGKSTVILARIKYMVDCGVNPEDITVISFTNAAADHIKELNKDVHSMTFALMIHKIYQKNYPDHELSSMDTLINSLGIYLPNDSFAIDFARRLRKMAANEGCSFTSMNNFIEENFEDVVRVLDAIKQTALELEIMICYQNIDNMTEPADVLSRYLIIDEVQDNSIFEFIYALKYVAKHRESLFIVGKGIAHVKPY